MARPGTKTDKHHVRKQASRRGEWSRFEKERAERDAKQRHLDAVRAVREARA